MALTPGARLGSYEIVSELGAGGMGEVYRARDTKLDRDVALKILPESFAGDPHRLMRFEREAKTLASLNHPNIAAIYGIEHRAIAMELVEGDDLSARIARGALTLDDALAIARQIADALEAAHESGVVHRDLKPANIKVRDDGTVKVLDFGLAKLGGPGATGASGASGAAGVPGASGASRAETMTSPAATELGMILGTAAYMSPEQAKGRPVDQRADVWAFGVILLEMLTGESIFAADSVGESIAAVLTREPDWSRVPTPTRRLLQACLQKDPRKRLRNVGDAFLLLETEAEAPSAPGRRSPMPWLVGSLTIGAVAATLGMWALRSTSPPAPVAFTERAPEGTRFSDAPLVSPDGQYLAILARPADGPTQVWVRALGEAAARPLAGTEGASLVFWSPDSAHLAFWVAGELRRVPRGGGLPQRVAAVRASAGVWTPDGEMIVVGDSGMFRVAADGGLPQQLLADREGAFANLALMGSGRHLLIRQFGGATGLYVLDLDSLEVRPLGWDAGTTLDSGAIGFAAPDVILYLQEQDLVGRYIDSASATMAGEPFPVVAGISGFAGSSAGAISYIPRTAVTGRLTWRDRDGVSLGTVGEENDYREVYLSASGTRLMFAAAEQRTGNLDLWIQDLDAPAANRFTTDPNVDHLAVFSPDDLEVVWEGHRGGNLTVFRRRSDAADTASVVRHWNRGGGPTDWSPDGEFVLYQSQEGATRNDLWVMPMKEETEPFPLVASEFEDTDGKISPDGRWLAYVSTASGREEVYLQRLDGWTLVGGPQRVSSGGGSQPLWRHDGSELFYLAGNTLSVVATSLDAASPAGTPRALFEVTRTLGYAVSRDGQRFLMIDSHRQTSDSAVVVLNWASSVPRR